MIKEISNEIKKERMEKIVSLAKMYASDVNLDGESLDRYVLDRLHEYVNTVYPMLVLVEVWSTYVQTATQHKIFDVKLFPTEVSNIEKKYPETVRGGSGVNSMSLKLLEEVGRLDLRM